VSFWDAIERHLAELDEGADAPDPWASVEVDDATLTDEQIALLAGLEDQPSVPHLDLDDLPGD